MTSTVPIVTTSWDDADLADLKLAEMLQTRGVTGTFYVPIKYRERSLSHSELRALASAGFEIGAHGYSHKHLCGLPPQELTEEVGPCKCILEDVLGKEVKMFCYPRGRYDSNTVRALKNSGYKGARTVRMDSDTTTRVGDHARLLREFESEGDVLVGTQMVAK